MVLNDLRCAKRTVHVNLYVQPPRDEQYEVTFCVASLERAKLRTYNVSRAETNLLNIDNYMYLLDLLDRTTMFSGVASVGGRHHQFDFTNCFLGEHSTPVCVPISSIWRHRTPSYKQNILEEHVVSPCNDCNSFSP